MEINKFYKTTMTPNKFICYLKCVLIFPSHNSLDSQSCAENNTNAEYCGGPYFEKGALLNWSRPSVVAFGIAPFRFPLFTCCVRSFGHGSEGFSSTWCLLAKSIGLKRFSVLSHAHIDFEFSCTCLALQNVKKDEILVVVFKNSFKSFSSIGLFGLYSNNVKVKQKSNKGIEAQNSFWCWNLKLVDSGFTNFKVQGSRFLSLDYKRDGLRRSPIDLDLSHEFEHAECHRAKVRATSTLVRFGYLWIRWN